MYKVVFVCGSRDYHAMDWFRSAEKHVASDNLFIASDLISSEGYKDLLEERDKLIPFFVLDKYLGKQLSPINNLRRHIMKVLVIPIQVYSLIKWNKSNPKTIYIAHSMYYIWLCALARLDFIGVPQGSDILVKPDKSVFYRWMSSQSLRRAKSISVDSSSMAKKCYQDFHVQPHIVQNGIAIKKIRLAISEVVKKPQILSVRALTPLYRITLIKSEKPKVPVKFIYPFFDVDYRKEVFDYETNFIDLGRVERLRMYRLMAESLLVISIPISDSSPRSVYEAIFCGSIVCITYNTYYDTLPDSMKERIIIVDLEQDNWLENAYQKAIVLSRKPFKPTDLDIALWDEDESFKNLLRTIEL